MGRWRTSRPSSQKYAVCSASETSTRLPATKCLLEEHPAIVAKTMAITSAFIGAFLPNVKDEPRAACGRAVFLRVTWCGGAEEAWSRRGPNQRIGSGDWLGVRLLIPRYGRASKV